MRQNVLGFFVILLFSSCLGGKGLRRSVAPAVEAADPQVVLYGRDGFHPAELGIYVAALVLYEGITGKDARSLPGEAVVAGRKLRVSEGSVRLLQQAAHETVARFAGN